MALVDEDEAAALFNVFGDDEPSHAKQARRFRAIAEAVGPAASGLIDDLAATRMRGLARARRRRSGSDAGRDPSRAGAGSVGPGLPDDPEILRALARHQADHHQRFVRRGAPNKAPQDLLLLQIADIYLGATGGDHDRYLLPHAERSHFIAFMRAALQPFFAPTEVSLVALARRWKRLKDLEAASRA